MTGIVLQSFFIACVLVTIPLSMAVGQQVENARQARVERDRVARIVDSANVAIIGADEIGRINSFNPAAQMMLGYRPDEVLGQFTTMFHTPEEISRLAADLGVPRRLRPTSRSSWRSRTPARSTSGSCAGTAPSAPTR